MANRLGKETSPYLLQHRDNPVDWYPWCDEAFARAETLDRPVFLSIGYSSCHWCHVMEHECFEDDQVAALLNEHFVSVKVDREERPDVDETYMMAVQLISGRGGWPISAFLTPDRKPFFAGTYFPKLDRGNAPGMVTLCTQIATAWTTGRRAELLSAAEEMRSALTEHFDSRPPASKGLVTPKGLDRSAVDQCVEAWGSDYDAELGGFGTAPKFPPHTGLDFLINYGFRADTTEDLRVSALGMAATTLFRMILGGIHDHVGGGFHRYSTDAEWKLPHFEKMLSDNALLLRNLSELLSIVRGTNPRLEARLESAANGVVDWLASEMRSPKGLFYSAVDADSEGEEGSFYVWRQTEIEQLLGDRAPAFIEAFGVKPEGNFLDEATGRATGRNVLCISTRTSDSFEEELKALFDARSKRVHPEVDSKALVGWNGLAIEALASVGAAPLAAIAALQILKAEQDHGRLPRQITNGVPSGEAYLEDYAYFAYGLLHLATMLKVSEENGYDMKGLPPWAFIESEAERLVSEMVRLFYDEKQHGFFATSDRHEVLFGASKPVFDHPLPSANAIAIRCLHLTGDTQRATDSLVAFAGWMERAPLATAALYATAMRVLPFTDSGLNGVPPEAEALVQSQRVDVFLEPRELKATESGLASGMVRLVIPAGLHINSSQPVARWLTPTRLEFEPLVATVRYPAPVSNGVSGAGDAGDFYEGEVLIPFEVQLPRGESGAEFEVTVTFQPCTETECLLPETRRLEGVAFR